MGGRTLKGSQFPRKHRRQIAGFEGIELILTSDDLKEPAGVTNHDPFHIRVWHTQGGVCTADAGYDSFLPLGRGFLGRRCGRRFRLSRVGVSWVSKGDTFDAGGGLAQGFPQRPLTNAVAPRPCPPKAEGFPIREFDLEEAGIRVNPQIARLQRIFDPETAQRNQLNIDDLDGLVARLRFDVHEAHFDA